MKKGHHHQKMLKGLTVKHMLVLSLALNVGLISRLFYDGERRLREFFCSFDEKQYREAIMAQFSGKNEVAQITALQQETTPSFSSSSTTPTDTPMDASQSIINLDHGDPTMYEAYWQQMGDKTKVVFSGWQSISYFSDPRKLCWFLEPEFASAVTRLHKLVGNAVTQDRHIVVGTGSSQLYQAVLYALSPPDASEPMSVVSAAPFYSSYPLMTDFLKSGLYKWDGDAYKFSKDKPYIELVTSPNNPDGSIRESVVNQTKGILVHDLAYYWPQYTPISLPADHDIMLFTVSKSTGHAGTRIGWALIKDQEIARKMTKYIELNTIGVSKDSQLRAAKILQVIADDNDHGGYLKGNKTFFEYSYYLMARRWEQLRTAVSKSKLFSLPDFSSGTCTFSGRAFGSQPAFAWLKCEGETEDCESFLRAHKILSRGGEHFGVGKEYVRISMLSRDEIFDQFTQRLSKINS